jgi:putative Ca2+/H+ antiporter (TMEM165/GDT1 family)
MRDLLTIFLSVFIAELGDKTQIATMLFATNSRIGKGGIFLASASALVVSSAIAVAAGELITRIVAPSLLKTLAGVGFILVGAWTLISASR